MNFFSHMVDAQCLGFDLCPKNQCFVVDGVQVKELVFKVVQQDEEGSGSERNDFVQACGAMQIDRCASFSARESL